MTDNITAYKIWAPQDSLWSDWAKPVLFAGATFYGSWSPRRTSIDWADSPKRDTAVVLDLPCSDAIDEGLALARLGWRPVPLYNGVASNSSSAVDSATIARALMSSAGELDAMRIAPDAPPAFLLDFDRMRGGGKRAGVFDNRWSVFAQDFPSAEFLKRHGIRNIILRSEAVRYDLAHILWRWQKAGITIFICDDGKNIAAKRIARPSGFAAIGYRFKTILGLSRNAAGGFGAKVPDSMVSSGGYSSGGTFYRMG